MNNKLSELSKPVAWRFKNSDGGDRVSLERKANIYGRHNFQPCYSQEYVSALLAELEAKDERIAELEGQLQSGFTPEALAQEERAENAEQRVAELEAKLDTPVRLPTTSGRLGVAYTRVIPEVIEAIRAAGFTVEGDE